MSQPLSHYTAIYAEKVMPLQQDQGSLEFARFRKQVAEQKLCPKRWPYEAHKMGAFIYRGIFIGLSLLFFLLMSFISFQKISWVYSFYVGYSLFPKIALCTLCVLAGLTSLYVAWAIRPEREAAHYLVKKAEERLTRCYRHQRARFGLSWFTALWRPRHDVNHIHNAYYEVSEHLHDIKEGTLTILHQIAQMSHLSYTQKARLFNHVIQEMRTKLDKLIHRFLPDALI
jgi:hypothetical protein